MVITAGSRGGSAENAKMEEKGSKTHIHISLLQYFCQAMVQEWKWRVIDARKHGHSPGGKAVQGLAYKNINQGTNVACKAYG